MKYDEDIQEQARKMYEKVDELKAVIADIVIETHKEYLYIDIDNDRKLSNDAAKVLDMVSEIRDISNRMVDMIEDEMK